MADETVGVPKEEKPSSGKIEQRIVFVSHAHADRRLAAELRKLIEETYSEVVKAYFSSDPSPAGGIPPGKEWYPAIHDQLSAAESVWVLATATSIRRPWIYWEAGIGRAICPGSVVVLRVGVSNAELPSPLNQFQSCDGLVAGEGGVGELLGKVASQIGMKISPILVEKVAETWVTAASNHEPEVEGAATGPELLPEQLGQFGALVARLESAVNSVGMIPSRVEPPRRRVQRPSQEARDERRRQRASLNARVLGVETSRLVYFSLEEMIGVIDSAPRNTEFSFAGIDSDGDANIVALREDERTNFYLEGHLLEGLEAPEGCSARVRRLIGEIVDALDQWVAVSE